MLAIKEITLDLRPRYRELTQGNEVSYYSFTNLFMSRDCTYYRYVEIEGGICVLCLPPHKGPMCMFPLGVDNLGKAFEALRAEFPGLECIPMTRAMTERVEKECPGLMEFSEVRDSFDYVYETEKMIRLQGKPYHSKRNFISRFVSRYDYEYIPLDQSNVEFCLPMMEQWFAEHPGYISPMFNERQAMMELIHNFDRLELKGAAIRVEGAVRAFSFGEYLQPKMAHILIEKADTTYPGLYPMINREFLEHAWADTEFVNREEDMGLEGLRKAKLSYHPDHMNEIFVGKFMN